MQATLVPRGVALKDLNKKIDGAMGLSLSLTDTDVLERALQRAAPLNQRSGR